MASFPCSIEGVKDPLIVLSVNAYTGIPYSYLDRKLIGAIILTQNHKKIVTNDAHFDNIPGLTPIPYSMD